MMWDIIRAVYEGIVALIALTIILIAALILFGDDRSINAWGWWFRHTLGI